VRLRCWLECAVRRMVLSIYASSRSRGDVERSHLRRMATEEHRVRIQESRPWRAPAPPITARGRALLTRILAPSGRP